MKLKPFQMPQSVLIKDTDNFSYAKFEIGPFERGFGYTMGNVLRRILLSSIHGISITKIRFDKVYHEFSTIEGVKENVTDIILNIKKLKFKMPEDIEQKIISIKVKGPAEISAGDLELPADIEIVNSEEYLFTITQKTEIKMELHLEWGRGYVPAQYIEKDKTIGTIEIDAFFSPIKRVITKVENTRVGQRTDYDKLILEIFTDGTISPEESLEQAVIILKGHIDVFNIKEELPVIIEDNEDDHVLEMRAKLEKKVSELELKQRTKNCMDINNINTIADLVQKSRDELLSYKNFGRQSLTQLEEKLEKMGLSLGMDISRYIKNDKNKE